MEGSEIQVFNNINLLAYLEIATLCKDLQVESVVAQRLAMAILQQRSSLLNFKEPKKHPLFRSSLSFELSDRTLIEGLITTKVRALLVDLT